MCGRYVCSKAPEVYGSFYDVIVPPIAPNFNVAPTHNVPVVRTGDGKRECVLQRWGLIPSWATDKKALLINARADTVATKPAFRTAFKKRRCLILADGYYEWKRVGKTRQPYLFRLKSDEPFAFAGLWETWHGEGPPIESCAIITTEANELGRVVHDRMPVILLRDSAEAWLDPGVAGGEALQTLLRPLAAQEMVSYPVSIRVGKISENDPALIEPATLER